MLTTPEQSADELPPPACIATNVGEDRPQHFMLSTKYGVELFERGAGSTLNLYTADQFRTALAASRAKDEALMREAVEALTVLHNHTKNNMVICGINSQAKVAVRALRARLEGDKPC